MNDSRYPEASFSLFETTDSNGDYVVFTVNAAYKDYEYKEDYPWCLSILIDIESAEGYPTSEESELLNQLEDRISGRLSQVCNCHYIVRITTKESRQVVFYLDDPEQANELLNELVDDPNSVRQWEYDMREDYNWENVEYFLSSLQT
jgi:hypothetical protein